MTGRGARAAAAGEDAERVVVRLHRSGRHLVLPAVIFLLLCAGTGYAWDSERLAWLRGALPVLAPLLLVLCCLLPVLRWLDRVVVITTRRLIARRGVFGRERAELLLAPGAEASLRRSAAQLLTGAGDVVVRAGERGGIVLRDVPRARLVHRAVADLIESASSAGDPSWDAS